MLCISDTNPLATSQKHLHRRVLADKHYRKNAERMKERYKKIKKIQTFNVGDAVSVRIPRIDCASTDLHRLPSVVVERRGKKYFLYRLLCKFGVLESCYPESELEAYGTALQLDITDWEKAPVVTLREASKSANPSNAYYGTTCHCKKGCGGMQCTCRKAGKPCSSRCHSGRPCKNCSGHAVQEHNSLKHSELCASLDQSSDFTSSPRSLSPAHSPVKHKAVSTITTCNCKSGCGGKRCSCRKTGKPCSSQCHSGRPCKNCSGHAVQEHNSLKHSELCASLDQSSDFTSSPRSLSPAHSPVKHKAVSTITTCNCKSGCGGKRCSCRKAGNPCSPWCHCHLGKPCQNSGYDSGQGGYKECNSPDQSSSFASFRSPLSPLSHSSAEKISVSSSSSPAALDWWVKDLLLTV